jgi:hypothetical protein
MWRADCLAMEASGRSTAAPLTVAPAIALALALLLTLTSMPPAAMGGGAIAVEVLDQALPVGTSMSCACYTGEVVYMFGGFTQGSLLDTIVEVDPATGTSRVLEWRLPSERKLSSAVWTGDAAYVIGGVGFDGDLLPEVLRFVPGEGVETVDEAIPWGTKGVSAVWTGKVVLVLGNCKSATEGQFGVLAFDPATNETEVLQDVLPVPGAGSSAVWTGDGAYIFGGRLGEAYSDLVVRYEPGRCATVMDARLPSPRFGTAAAWDGARAYVFGGSNALVCGPVECVPTEYLDDVVVFDPALDEAWTHWARLPSPRDVRAAVWAGGRALVLGGETLDGPVAGIVALDPFVPFHGEDDPMDERLLCSIAVVGGVILILTFAWTVRGWNRPPLLSGGTLQS